MRLYLIAFSFMLFQRSAHAQSNAASAFQVIKPIASKLEPLPLNAVKPTGWLKQELQKNLNGFTGHLDSLVPDLIVNDDIYGKNRLRKDTKSKSVGALAVEGDFQVQYLWWNSETQSNWLDGLMRTSVLLNDPIALKRVGQMIDRLLATQDADGYLGIYDRDLRYKFDQENGELWAKTTLYRVLLGWYEYTKDEKVLAAVVKAVDNVMLAYPIHQSHPFYSVNPDAVGVTHGLAFTDVLEQLYGLTKKQGYLEYALFLYEDFSQQTLNEDAQLHKLLEGDLPLKGHGVHTYEHFRSVVAAYYASGNPVLQVALDNFLAKIKCVTSASGGPIGDEFIGGRVASGALGYEFCSLHELLAGWISLYTKSGNGAYGEYAEHLFFNAALGNTHPTESAICYLKQDDAFSLSGGNNGDTSDQHQTRYRYSPVHKEAAVCCVPNAGRIVPYYVQNMWMKDADGLVASLLGPCELHTTIQENAVTIQVETEYPFGDSIRIKIRCQRPMQFMLKIRRPEWAEGIFSTLNLFVQNNSYYIFERMWGEETEFTISFSSRYKIKQTSNHEMYVESGPFVLCHVIDAPQEITKTYPKFGMRESVYKTFRAPVLYWLSYNLLPVPNQAHTYAVKMHYEFIGNHGPVFNPLRANFRAINNVPAYDFKPIILQPMARTILRQVTFPVKY